MKPLETSRSGEVCKFLVYSLLCVAADILDTFLSPISNIKHATSLLPSDVDELSDEGILELLPNSSIVHPDYGVARVTPGTVCKQPWAMNEYASDSPEANALNLVFAETTIPVPRVRRVIKATGGEYLIVMDYIKGRLLSEVWSTFSLWKKIRVAFTLRRYIRQLRRLKASPSTPPGPLSAQGPQRCVSPIFGQVQPDRGPFASYAEMSAFFEQRAKMAFRSRELPEDHPWRKERFDDSSPLVLTHNDLNPRNIIVGDDGLLWIIDWTWAGYYPPWFEYVAMLRQMENEEVLGFNHHLWTSFIPFICGPYFKQERWLWRMSGAFYYK